ncbi:MAG TPA: hypothetical protein VHL58_02885 [Thermoanaerobaculia bacterium]|nr:hypothetical protein [Thermoanaerobaculia bacterium]
MNLDAGGIALARYGYTPTVTSGQDLSLVTWIDGATRMVRGTRISDAGLPLDIPGLNFGSAGVFETASVFDEHAFFVTATARTDQGMMLTITSLDEHGGAPVHVRDFLLEKLSPSAYSTGLWPAATRVGSGARLLYARVGGEDSDRVKRVYSRPLSSRAAGARRGL